MKVTVSFRAASQSDIPFLLELRKCSMTKHLQKAGLQINDEYHLARVKEFFNDSHLILINDKPIGLVKVGLTSDSFHIRQLQILPDYSGQGIGSFVLEVLQKKARVHYRDITLNVLLANPAKNLYERHGFIVTGSNELEYQMRWYLKPIEQVVKLSSG